MIAEESESAVKAAAVPIEVSRRSDGRPRSMDLTSFSLASHGWAVSGDHSPPAVRPLRSPLSDSPSPPTAPLRSSPLTGRRIDANRRRSSTTSQKPSSALLPPLPAVASQQVSAGSPALAPVSAAPPMPIKAASPSLPPLPKPPAIAIAGTSGSPQRSAVDVKEEISDAAHKLLSMLDNIEYALQRADVEAMAVGLERQGMPKLSTVKETSV